jgi:hypothetical protein
MSPLTLAWGSASSRGMIPAPSQSWVSGHWACAADEGRLTDDS